MLRVFKTITACIALFLCTPALGQEGQIPFHIECDTAHFHYIDYIDSLSHYENKMGEKKHLNTSDKMLTLAFYVALSHYPELHDKRISLRLKSLVSTMQAQPSPNFIIKRKSKRSYRIYVNDNVLHTDPHKESPHPLIPFAHYGLWGFCKTGCALYLYS